MIFSLIICTYKRPLPLLKLLRSLKEQTFYPNEILIIDGSPDKDTMRMLCENNFEKLKYYQVEPEFRGLTRQRNYGIAQVAKDSEVVCFLDDDTVLSPNYFEQIIKTFKEKSDAVGVGGVAINENRWELKSFGKVYNQYNYYEFEDYVLKESLRNRVRNYLGLNSNLGPGKMPEYSHGRTCGFPLTGNTYEVDLLIGMSMAFRKNVLEQITFSKYFEGYGLYEDADFSIRTLRFGKNYMNTQAQLYHYHDSAGRPNKYTYGKMVVRNGWYVWRVKYPNPTIKAKLKWNIITVLLIIIRFSNTFTSTNKKESLKESYGRTIAWFQLLTNKPKIIL